MTDLFMSIKDIAERFGADYVGVADLALAHDAVLEQGGEWVAKYPACVSIGIAMMDSIVNLLSLRDQKPIAITYRSHNYDVINDRLDMVASVVASELQRRGHEALPMPSSMRVSNDAIAAAFSHKLGARHAGLGWIGKNCMLITPDRGPRVRWISVLTDAPLAATGSAIESRCGDCTECVTACPVQAYTGRNYIDGEPREARYDASKCDAYLHSNENGEPFTVCGLCVYACPYGRRRESR